VNNWLTHHLALFLGSLTGMYLALLVPIVAFGVPPLLKVLGLISSYWIQLWALFVLQRGASNADIKREAKADADHAALSHIAVTTDRAFAVLQRLTGKDGGE